MENEFDSFMNRAGIKHRHDRVFQKAWKILETLDNMMSIPDREVKTRHREMTKLAGTSVSMYEDFYVYLIYTAQIVLENALFSYRAGMSEYQFSCVGKIAYTNNMEDRTIIYAEIIMVGGTPSRQRYNRLRVMGYDWISARKAIAFGGAAYQRTFIKPLNVIISAAARLGASSDAEIKPASRQDLIE